MKIEIEPHTLLRAEERGTDQTEILDVLETGIPVIAKQGRFAKVKIFNYNKTRNNKFYLQKRVEVIYKKEKEKIITITVYVFYGKWE